MSDNIKLIIEIPKDTYKARQHWVTNPKRMVDEVDIAIAHGIPLEDIKAEIFDKAIKDASGEGFIFLGRLLRIFDNIGKAESEGNPNEQ